MSQYLITHDVNLHYLGKMVSVGFSHWKVTLFPFIIKKYLGEDILS